MRILSGDVGGTKTLLELAEINEDRLDITADQRYSSHDHTEFDAIVADFLGRHGGPLAAACIGVAGPVSVSAAGQTAQITNLPWRLDSQALANRFGIPRVRLINDFEAVALGLDGLTLAELEPLQTGTPDPHGVRLVIGAGTGLGVALMVPDGNRGYTVHPTEAGHADFAPASGEQLELAACLLRLFGRVSNEHVLSGPGLVNIYRVLHERMGRNPADLQRLLACNDAAAAVANAAERGDCVANQAVDLFIAIYGGVAGNLALACLPTGGVYIAGGIAPKMIDRLRRSDFIQAFHARGKMAGLMERFPVQVVMNPHVGLIGARLTARRLALAT